MDGIQDHETSVPVEPEISVPLSVEPYDKRRLSYANTFENGMIWPDRVAGAGWPRRPAEAGRGRHLGGTHARGGVG